MSFYYKMDVLLKLKNEGYSTYRLRKEKIIGESAIQKLRDNCMVSWDCLAKICELLNVQPGDIIGYRSTSKMYDIEKAHGLK